MGLDDDEEEEEEAKGEEDEEEGEEEDEWAAMAAAERIRAKSSPAPSLFTPEISPCRVVVIVIDVAVDDGDSTG